MRLPLCLLLCFGLNLYTKAQFVGEMQYVKNKGVILEGQMFKKHRAIKSIIDVKNDSELTSLFKKYRRTHSTRQVIARIRDFGLIYSVFNAFAQPQIYPVPLAVGLTAAGGAELLTRPSNTALKNLVEKYNDIVLIEKIKRERELRIAPEQ